MVWAPYVTFCRESWKGHPSISEMRLDASTCATESIFLTPLRLSFLLPAFNSSVLILLISKPIFEEYKPYVNCKESESHY